MAKYLTRRGSIKGVIYAWHIEEVSQLKLNGIINEIVENV